MAFGRWYDEEIAKSKRGDREMRCSRSVTSIAQDSKTIIRGALRALLSVRLISQTDPKGCGAVD